MPSATESAWPLEGGTDRTFTVILINGSPVIGIQNTSRCSEQMGDSESEER